MYWFGELYLMSLHYWDKLDFCILVTRLLSNPSNLTTTKVVVSFLFCKVAAMSLVLCLPPWIDSLCANKCTELDSNTEQIYKHKLFWSFSPIPIKNVKHLNIGKMNVETKKIVNYCVDTFVSIIERCGCSSRGV